MKPKQKAKIAVLRAALICARLPVAWVIAVTFDVICEAFRVKPKGGK